MAPARAPRRTQAERTAATRAALLEATVQCLVTQGFGGTTTTEVAHRAGVSPGALLHHFPAKADLLCAAVGHLFELRQAEFRKAMADLCPGTDRRAAGLDLLWSMFSGPTFTAWLELWMAARSDPALAEAVIRLDREFMAASEDVFRELFADEIAAAPEVGRAGARPAVLADERAGAGPADPRLRAGARRGHPRRVQDAGARRPAWTSQADTAPDGGTTHDHR